MNTPPFENKTYVSSFVGSMGDLPNIFSEIIKHIDNTVITVHIDNNQEKQAPFLIRVNTFFSKSEYASLCRGFRRLYRDGQIEYVHIFNGKETYTIGGFGFAG